MGITCVGKREWRLNVAAFLAYRRTSYQQAIEEQEWSHQKQNSHSDRREYLQSENNTIVFVYVLLQLGKYHMQNVSAKNTEPTPCQEQKGVL